MSSTGIPWQQEPEYVAACRTQLQPEEPGPYSELSEQLGASDSRLIILKFPRHLLAPHLQT